MLDCHCFQLLYFCLQVLENDPNFASFFRSGDVVQVDRGFKIKAAMGNLGVRLSQPSFLDGRTQFTGEEIEKNKLIASGRAVNETANARIKYQKILGGIYPNNQIHYLEEYIKLASGLANHCYNPLRFVYLSFRFFFFLSLTSLCLFRV